MRVPRVKMGRVNGVRNAFILKASPTKKFRGSGDENEKEKKKERKRERERERESKRKRVEITVLLPRSVTDCYHVIVIPQ